MRVTRTVKPYQTNCIVLFTPLKWQQKGVILAESKYECGSTDEDKTKALEYYTTHSGVSLSEAGCQYGVAELTVSDFQNERRSRRETHKE